MLQIIGTKSSRDTLKAIRFVKERNISYQFVDLTQRKLSEKELNSIFNASIGVTLIDTTSSYYKKNGYSYRVYDEKEELREHNELFILPILRNSNKVNVGYREEFILENKE